MFYSDMEPDAECLHVQKDERLWKQRIRFHQSWWRRHWLRREAGTYQGRVWGNHLTRKDASEGLNFLTNEIVDVVNRRLARGDGLIEKERLFQNLLSSQPMCFNLFGPLTTERGLELASGLLAALDPGRFENAKVLRVEIEYAPPKKDMLNDSSAFDCWIEYEKVGGALGFVGIETKLRDSFSDDSYALDAPDRRYGELCRKPGAWWRSACLDRFGEKSFNQLWRNHLLGFALRGHETKYEDGFVAVVHHQTDEECAVVIPDYRLCLTTNGDQSLLEWNLERVTASLQPLAERGIEALWVEAFRHRYVTFSDSEAAWQLHRSAKRRGN